MLNPGQIIYGSATISRKFVDNPNQPNPNLTTQKTSSSLAKFISIRIAQSYIYIVYILRMLKSNINNGGDNKPNSLK